MSDHKSAQSSEVPQGKQEGLARAKTDKEILQGKFANAVSPTARTNQADNLSEFIECPSCRGYGMTQGGLCLQCNGKRKVKKIYG